jgi:hypothetical protein
MVQRKSALASTVTTCLRIAAKYVFFVIVASGFAKA